MLNIIKQECQIIEIIQETPNTKTFRLNVAESFSFVPGQFAMLHVNMPNKDKPEKRAYSFSSSPLRKNHIDLTVKQENNGLVSTHLVNNVVKGDMLTVSGPFGRFTFDDETVKEVVLIAAGSGVAPLRSMLQYIFDKKLQIKVHLFFSVRNEADIIFKEEFEQYTKEHNNFTYVLTLTNPPDDWEGNRGRLSLEMVEEHSDNPDRYYICGPLGMVNQMQNQLLENGVDKEKIRVEKY